MRMCIHAPSLVIESSSDLPRDVVIIYFHVQLQGETGLSQ